MARITTAGHSLHAILNDWPIGLFTTSLFFDCLGTMARKRNLEETGFYTLAAGYVTGVGAALTGIAEYRAVQREGDVKRLADRHAVVNVAVMTLNTIALVSRIRNQKRVTKSSLALSVAANALTVLSAWYGDEMVYGHQVRVGDRHIKVDDRDWRLPGDEKITSALRAGTQPSAMFDHVT